MAWWGNSTPVTYQDHLKQMDGGGDLLPMVELIEEYSPMVEDMIVMEANETNGHRAVVRRGYPEPTWRKMNAGVAPTKSSSAPIVDGIGNMEAYAEVDKDIADLNGNTAMFRLGEAAAHVEGMTNALEDVMFYGDQTTPEKFIGLTPRFNTLTAAETGSQVINGGGDDATNMSMWFVTWDPRICHGIFPRGSMAGLQRDDKGQQTAYDTNGLRFEIYREHFKWQVGLHIKDWRYTARVANLKTVSVQADSVDLVKFLIKASHKVRRGNVGKTIIYMHPDLAASLDTRVYSDRKSFLSHREYAGQEVLHFRQYPIRESDALLQTEALVA